MLKQCTAVATS